MLIPLPFDAIRKLPAPTRDDGCRGHGPLAIGCGPHHLAVRLPVAAAGILLLCCGCSKTSTTAPASASGAATLQLELVDDTADPHVATTTDSAGYKVDWFGTKDGSGSATGIYGAISTSPAGKSVTYVFDSQGRPLSAIFAGGTAFSFNWSSASSVSIRAVSSDSKTIYEANVTDIGPSRAPVRPAFRGNPLLLPRASGAGSATVAVTSCGGHYAQSGATVTATSVNTVTANETGLWTNSPPANAYSTVLPTAVTLPPDLSAALAGFADATENICSWQDAGSAAYGQYFGAVACAALAAASGPLAPGLFADCEVVFQGIEAACNVNSAISTAQRVSPELFNSPTRIYTVTATLPDGRTGTTTITGPPYGQASIDLECRAVDHVGILPLSASIPQGGTQQFVGYAADNQGRVNLGSEVNLLWSSLATSIATVAANGGFLGDLALVKGLSPGTTAIQLTETNSQKSEHAPITVTGAQVQITPSSANLNIGQTLPFTATLLDSSGKPIAGGAFTWSSSAPAVASVGASSGVVSALAAGSAVITAQNASGHGTATVAVSSACMTGTWVGTYSDTFGENGTLTAVLVQSGTSVTGTQTIVGNPGSASPGTYSSSVTGTLTSSNGVQNFIFGPLFFGGEQDDGVGTVSANCSTSSGSFITPGGVNIGTYSATKQ